jgi:2-polyprenyl-6-methoxyphenol hydroxylase-like FAD-dependent oxidoreductase
LISSKFDSGINHSKFKDLNSKEELEVESKFLIGCDGVRSDVRNLMRDQSFIGTHSLQQFLNIHFKSKELS